MKKALRIISFILIAIHLFISVSIASDTVTFYHTDPAGTPLAMSDSSGNIVWKADYKPFGEEQITAATQENYKMFVGKEKDKETGLYYFGARYLKDKIGRFTSVDSVGPVDPATSKTNYVMLANPQKLNKYAYALNNPYRYVDSDGQMATELGAAFGTVIAPGPGTILGTVIGGVVDAGLGLAGAYVAYKAGEAIYNKVTGKEEDAGSKEGNASVGQTAAGQATDKYGNKLGPSGKPVRHKVEHSTEKGAKDAAAQEGPGTPVKHPSPKKGDPHYHPTDESGNKIPGSTHHEF